MNNYKKFESLVKQLNVLNNEGNLSISNNEEILNKILEVFKNKDDKNHVDNIINSIDFSKLKLSDLEKSRDWSFNDEGTDDLDFEEIIGVTGIFLKNLKESN